MTMNITRKLFEVAVTPELNGFTNIVTRVRWGLEFEKGGFTSLSCIETFLDISKLSNFKPINQITKEQILQWAFDTQNGEQLIKDQWIHHENMIEYEFLNASVKPYEGFELDNVKTNNNNSRIDIPTTVL